MKTDLSLKRNKIASLAISAFMLGMVAVTGITVAMPATPAYAAVLNNQCNDVDNTGGLAVECDVTVTNNLDQATGVMSSVVVVRECHGVAGADPTCTTTTIPNVDLVTSVTQCNGSTNGGGATLDCSVRIVNNITGTGTVEPATVNQCIGSGEDGGTQPTIICDPVQETTGATVTQCNGSGNGGGGAGRVLCNVLTSTQTSALPITVNQCNGSSNGGGSTVICDVQILNNIIPPVVVVPPTDVPPVVVIPPTDVPPVVEVPPTDTTPPTDGTPPTNGTPPRDGTPPGDNNTPPRNLAETGVDAGPALFIGGGFLALGAIAMVLAKRRNKVATDSE